MFGSTFFTLTGFHGSHVTIGVFWLLSLVAQSSAGGCTRPSSGRDRRPVLALRRHRLDLHLHARLSHSGLEYGLSRTEHV